jgi:isoamylase
VFRRRRFFHGAYSGAGGAPADIAWLTPAGDEMTEEDWHAGYAKSVAVFLNGAAISEPDPRGDPVTDKKFLLLFNAGAEAITFTIPGALGGDGADGAETEWEIVIDTLSPRGEPADATGFLPKTKVEVASRAIVVLRSRR